MTALWSFALACFRSPKLKKDGKKAKKTIGETQPASNVEEGQTLVSPIFASSGSLKRINPFPEEIISGFGSGQFNGLTTHFGPVGSSEIRIQENSYELENQKDSESPRYQALLPMTSTPKKRFFGEIKSFSHELNSKGVRPFPLWKSRRSNNSKEILNSIRTKFDKAKEEVNSDLSIFAGDLLDVNNKYKETHPELAVAIQDLLVLAKKCATTTSGEFWLQCEDIVQDLDDKRQELSPGVLKKLHTRMLFILTRYSRLLQFHNESLWHKEPRILHSADMRVPTGEVRDDRGSSTAKALKVSSTKKAYYGQEQHGLNSKEGFVVRQTSKDPESSANIDRMSPSPALKGVKEDVVASKEQSDSKVEPPKMVKKRVGLSNDMAVAKAPYYRPTRLSHEHVIFVRQQRNISWGYWGNESCFSEETSIICRICEEEVPTTHLEEHSRICVLANRYNQKVVSIDELLVEIAVTLEKITKNLKQKSNLAAVESQDPIELSFKGKGTFNDQNDISQMSKLAAIARSAANVIQVDEQSPKFLIGCLRDSIHVTLRRKFNALTVETFGTRIQKLIQEKYLQLGEILDFGKVNISRMLIDESAALEDGVVLSFQSSLVYRRDRTSIDDFEIIKLISSGAFGRVVLARKKTTKDLFAIKILKKADMIRKNAVESILSERNILSKVSNPFVVRFFYSFTCSKKMYLVMEYVNGGDLYSLLKQVVCLDESDARLYIAELVLALEYLHSKGIVHRDLKPDNFLIAHDGHIKLTDFGLSKVGLINSTDDLSSPSSSAKSLLVEEKPKWPTSEHKQSAVGTPDYLAPEILLGTGHGATSDWWSVGVILYEFIVGMPPFNAEQPQEIFDNILNRDLQWPEVPDEMSHEAYDLIDRLLTEDPHQRLGARGAAEVKQHVFFKDINWDTLAQQKATFLPDSKNPLDTSYFKSRNPRNYSDEQCFPTNENEDSSDDDNLNGERVSGFETSVSENDSFDNFSFKRHEEKEKKKGTFI